MRGPKGGPGWAPDREEEGVRIPYSWRATRSKPSNPRQGGMRNKVEAMGKPELLGLGKALERRLNLQKKEKKVASQMTAEELREEIRRLRTRVTDQANKHPFVRRKDGQPAVWQGEIALEYTSDP